MTSINTHHMEELHNNHDDWWIHLFPVPAIVLSKNFLLFHQSDDEAVQNVELHIYLYTTVFQYFISHPTASVWSKKVLSTDSTFLFSHLFCILHSDDSHFTWMTKILKKVQVQQHSFTVLLISQKKMYEESTLHTFTFLVNGCYTILGVTVVFLTADTAILRSISLSSCYNSLAFFLNTVICHQLG